MRSFREQDLGQALESSDVAPGDVVVVHSALFSLGQIEGATIDELPARIYAGLRDHLGPSGTVVVPTFNFDFCRGMEFNRQYTPSDGMGAFSEFVRQLPQAHRSPHPMQSVAAVGPVAADLARRDTPGAFDPEGPFEALIDFDATILMLGCGIDAVSLVHWAEQKVGVPYRYWKEFSAPYRDHQWAGRRTYRMYVRDLELDPTVRLHKIGRVLRRNGELRRLAIGAGALQSCRARHFASAAVRLLHRDPCVLVRPSDHSNWSPHARS